jgi:hypothetical protein
VDPLVTVSMMGARGVSMLASIATSEERARLWPIVISDQARYAGYQENTDREIPLVLLQSGD